MELVGISAETGRKVVLSLGLVVAAMLVRALVRLALNAGVRGPRLVRVRFWARQAASIGAGAVIIIGLVSIWFDDPTRLTTAVGLVTAGLAFALQRVVTAIAGYAVIMRGKTFSVGDRIVMGGVRGDVIALQFTQTTIMEMGQPPPVQNDDPAMWVKSRHYTGRIVTVSNARVFDEPVYNYTSEFPFLWEEITVPVPYDADRTRAEQILEEAAQRHTHAIQEMGEEERVELMRRYFVRTLDVRPRVFVRLTDNWIELTVRFLARDHQIRELKDAISRDILAGFDEAGITVASATFAIAGLPPVRVDVRQGKIATGADTMAGAQRSRSS